MATALTITYRVMAIAALVFGIALPAVRAQAPAPAPVSDGSTYPLSLLFLRFSGNVLPFFSPFSSMSTPDLSFFHVIFSQSRHFPVGFL